MKETPPGIQTATGRRHGLAGRLAGLLAASPLFKRARAVWAENEQDVNLRLSKWDKLRVGGYLILRDYARGLFPPRFDDQQQLYLSEMSYRHHAPGSSAEEITVSEMKKPFWYGYPMRECFLSFVKLTDVLEQIQVRPPAKLLELGGGAGWTAEFLAQLGYEVVSTTISPDDVASGGKRVEALRLKGIPAKLRFIAAPMESVDRHVAEHAPFDAAFVLAALHHAFDWRAALTSAYSSVKPGGWVLIWQEPNVLHTAISYRIACLSQSHEIGFSKKALVGHLRRAGCRRVLSFGKRLHFFYHTHWLAGQK